MLNQDNRIFSWQQIPRASRIMIISVMTIIVFITPNYAEGYYESSWVLIETDSENNYNAAVVDKNGDGWIFGDNGEIVHGVNLEVWTQFNSPTIENLTTAYQNDDLIVAAGNNGIVLYKQYDADVWTQTIIPEAHDINSVSINSNNEIYAVGDNGKIWCFKGQNWIEVPLNNGEDLLDIVFEGERGLIAGTSGLILGSEDNGETWEIRETPEQVSDSEIVSIGYYGINRGYAITSDGQILKSTQEALTTTVGYYWNLKEIESENMSTSLDIDLTSVEILSTTKILLAGENGYIALSKDGGNIVTPQLLPIDKDFTINDIAMRTAFVGIIVGDDGNIMYTVNGGEDEAVGFEILDLSDFSEFVDFTKDKDLEQPQDGWKE